MVYRPSQGHKVTLGSTRNIQCTTPNQFPKKETLWAVLISNDMARNRHHESCVSRTLSSKSHSDRASEGQPTRCHIGCSLHKEIWLNHAQYMYFIQPKKKKKKLYQPIGNIRLHDSQHVHGGLVQLNKNAIVDLKQTEQLKDFSDFRAHAINTAAKKKKKSSINPLQMYCLIPY